MLVTRLWRDKSLYVFLFKVLIILSVADFVSANTLAK
jgi:hypothetical protein